MTQASIAFYLQLASLALGAVFNAMLAFEANGILRVAGSLATALFLALLAYHRVLS